MRFKTAFAQTADGAPSENSSRAAAAIAAELAGFAPTMVIYFAATDYDPQTLAAAMAAAFPHAKTIGCTSSGEGVDGHILNASVVAMAFSAEVFDYCEIAMVLEKGEPCEKEGIFTSAEEAMHYLCRHTNQALIDLDYRRYVGFMMGDRIDTFSEGVLERVGELSDVIFVGGFAGDDYKFIDAQAVFFGAKAYTNAAILCLWKPRAGFGLLKTQAAETTEEKMVITRADEENRIIWEFDGEDAAPAYGRRIGAPVETMSIIDFDKSPLAILVDGEPWLRTAVMTVEKKGLKMFSRVREGTTHTITRAGDVYNVTRKALEERCREMGGYAAVLHINCASRHMALRNQGTVEAFGALFAGTPSVAFSSYGEIYINVMAMTSTMILFK